MANDKRTVHASARDWEIVRYDRAGKWFAEWIGEAPCPTIVEGERLRWFPNRSGRHRLFLYEVIAFAFAVDAVPHYGRPGGSTFDREHKAAAARMVDEREGEP